MKFRSGNKSNAVTLTELLFTIAVISAISIFTISVLVNVMQERYLPVQLKKACITLTKGFKELMVSEGCSNIQCTSFVSPYNSTARKYFILKDIFSVMKPCDSKECKYSIRNLDGTTNYTFGAQGFLNGGTSTGRSIMLNDGSIFEWYSSDACNLFTEGVKNGNQKACGWINVDVNGIKKPNRVGRDIFQLFIHNDGRVLPSNYYLKTFPSNQKLVSLFNDNENLCPGTFYNNGNAAWGCALRVMKESWEMNY